MIFLIGIKISNWRTDRSKSRRQTKRSGIGPRRTRYGRTIGRCSTTGWSQSRCRRRRRSWHINHRRRGHQLETQLSQQLALGRNMTGEFITVAYATDAHALYGARPPALDTFNAILSQPLKRILPHLTLLVGVCSSRGSRRKLRPRRLLLVTNDCEAVVASDIGNEGVQRGYLNRLETRPILLKDSRIPTMEGAEKQHDQEK